MPESSRHYLSQILELSERLLQTDLSPSQRDLATSLYSASAALRTHQLDRQRLTEETQQGAAIDFDLRALVHSLRDQFSGRRVLHCQLDPALTTRRSGDPETLRMALRLQLVPALTQAGPPIQLKLQTGSDEDRVLFEIHGQGLREESCASALVERLGGTFTRQGELTSFELPLPVSPPGPPGEVPTRSLAGAQVMIVSHQFETFRNPVTR